MAVAEMEKLTIVTHDQYKDAILAELQNLQSVEIIPLEQVIGEQAKNQRPANADAEDCEEHYERAEAALAVLRQYETAAGFKEKWRRLTKKKPRLSVSALDSVAGNENNARLIGEILDQQAEREHLQKERAELTATLSDLRPWRQVDVALARLNQTPYLTTRYGLLPNDANSEPLQAIQGDDWHVTEAFANEDTVGVIAVYPSENEAYFETQAEAAGFRDLTVDSEQSPKARIDELSAALEQNKADEDAIVRFLTEQVAVIPALRLLAEAWYNRWQRVKLDEELEHAHYGRHDILAIRGWMPKEQTETISEQLNDTVSEDVFALFHETPTEDEIQANQVPTKLENNAWVAPFEVITNMYGAPRYDEVDPTPFVMPFYALFFGMMAGDLGYGLVLFLLTAGAWRLFDFSAGQKNLVKLGFILSIPTMVVGLIYGSFFGFSLPIQPLSPLDNAITLMAISVVIGFVNIYIGLAIKTVSALKARDYLGAWSDGIAWLLLLTALVIFGLGAVLSVPLLTTISGVVAIATIIGMVLIPVLVAEKKGAALGAGLYNVYGITGYIGDFVSYTRLMALGLSGGSIALAFNMLLGFLPAPVRFTAGILLFLVLHGFNIFLSFLGAYVHSLRLIFVEFFGKFYEGGGHSFTPIAVLEKYTHIEQ